MLAAGAPPALGRAIHRLAWSRAPAECVAEPSDRAENQQLLGHSRCSISACGHGRRNAVCGGLWLTPGAPPHGGLGRALSSRLRPPPTLLSLCQRCPSAQPREASGKVTDMPYLQHPTHPAVTQNGHCTGDPAAAGQGLEEALWAMLTPSPRCLGWLTHPGQLLLPSSWAGSPELPAFCSAAACAPWDPTWQMLHVTLVVDGCMLAPPSLFLLLCLRLFCLEGAGPTPGPTPGHAGPHRQPGPRPRSPAETAIPASLPTVPSSRWSFPLKNLQGEALGLSSDRWGSRQSVSAPGTSPRSTVTCEPPAGELGSESVTHF